MMHHDDVPCHHIIDVQLHNQQSLEKQGPDPSEHALPKHAPFALRRRERWSEDSLTGKVGRPGAAADPVRADGPTGPSRQ